MDWDSILRRNSQVRPIWRFVASVGIVFAAYLVVGISLGLVFGVMGKRPGMLGALIWSHLILFPVLLGVFKFLTAVFERKPLGSVGLAPVGRWRAELGLGLALGAGMILAVAGVEMVFGLAKFSMNPMPWARVLARGLGLAVVLAVAAANEEMIFRGYPFQRLVDSLGPWGAVAVMSGLFAVVHVGNPAATWVSAVNTALVGVPLAVAYVRTRMLWMPMGIHFAWNFVQGFVLGLPVSGIHLPWTLLEAEVEGARWLTGGPYGPEGGLLATGIIIAGTLYLSRARSIYTSEETRRVVFGFAATRGGAAEPAVVPGTSPEPSSPSIGESS